jgi:hypothetical protein
MEDSIMYEHRRQELLDGAKKLISNLEAYSKMQHFISHVSVTDYNKLSEVDGYYIFSPSGMFRHRSTTPTEFAIKAKISREYSNQQLERDMLSLRKEYKAILGKLLSLTKPI